MMSTVERNSQRSCMEMLIETTNRDLLPSPLIETFDRDLLQRYLAQRSCVQIFERGTGTVPCAGNVV